jgi:hypothetical protein
MNYPVFDLADLDADLQEEKVRQAISDVPKENAPGSNRFIGAFYIKCWEIVKRDVVQAVRQLSQLRGKPSTCSTQPILSFSRRKSKPYP